MIDTERLATVGIKWAAIAVFGAGATWWVSRCIQSTVKEVREITSDVKDSIIVVQNLVQLPHLVKAIEFSTIPMDDPTWQWGRMYDMGRDFRAIAETARSIAESTALERGLGIAEKSIDHQLALDAAAADGSSGPLQLRNRRPEQPVQQQQQLDQMKQVKLISDNVYAIIDHPVCTRMSEVAHVLHEPARINQILQAVVLSIIAIIFAIWLAVVIR
eukprot:m.17673 g.17673  ORF g.17673 m.17673 type:complete len:216 (+) comp11276_c0_seq2:112-759(+)